MTLKPCPFCGSDDVLVEENATFTWVECQSCDARGTQVIGEEGAIKAWNRRAKGKK